MNNSFNFLTIKQYDNYIINITKKDYDKMQNCINLLKSKYNNEILNLYKIEKTNVNKFGFKNQKNFIIKHKSVLLNIISDVLKIYTEELDNLIIVFLSGSFARGTNKMSSDVDLHFFYNNDNYNYIYEEIVCYIISRVINKSRDSIDPTFIFNVESENKSMITTKMNDTKLNIILKYKHKEIRYSYKFGKKRRFYLQYTNTRDINKLFEYLNKEMFKHNDEWCHCFEIIKGKEIFNELYNKMYQKEIDLINTDYINNKIKILKEKIKILKLETSMSSISQYKNYYQSKIFKYIYEYISIIRFILIKENVEIKFLNLLEMYDLVQKNKNIDKCIFIEIYRYMWNLEKLTVYCYENNINYGLHNNDLIIYSTKELDRSLEILKKVILNDLERLGGLYG